MFNRWRNTEEQSDFSKARSTGQSREWDPSAWLRILCPSPLRPTTHLCSSTAPTVQLSRDQCAQLLSSKGSFLIPEADLGARLGGSGSIACLSYVRPWLAEISVVCGPVSVESVCLSWVGGVAWHFGKEGITAPRVCLGSQGGLGCCLGAGSIPPAPHREICPHWLAQ